MNASNKSRYTNTTSNRDQGGGDKKYGLIPTATGGSWYYRFIGANTLGQMNGAGVSSARGCCNARTLNALSPRVSQVRPIGRNNNAPYWHIVGGH